MFKAKLDEKNIYWGIEEVDSLIDGDFEIDKNCDLEIGKYKLVNGSFVPLLKKDFRDKPDDPVSDEALYQLIKSINNPPAYCIKWAEFYKTTLDAQVKI